MTCAYASCRAGGTDVRGRWTFCSEHAAEHDGEFGMPDAGEVARVRQRAAYRGWLLVQLAAQRDRWAVRAGFRERELTPRGGVPLAEVVRLLTAA